MRIVVVGAGGQGGCFGGLLAASGRDVTLIDRGGQLEAIRKSGLTLRPSDGEPFTVRARATDDPRSVGERDLVLVCVKTYDLDDALPGLDPLVGAGTAIVSVQNGIDAPDAIAAMYGAGRVVAGVSYVAARVEAPGVVSYGGVTGGLILGELEGAASERCRTIAEAFRSAGVESEPIAGIRTAMWRKLVLVAATGGVMALLRRPWGPVLDSRVGRALARGVMEEAEAVARACGVDLPEGTAESVFGFARANIGRSTRSSMLDDLLSGRRLELPALNGTIVRLGRETGVPTPLNSSICSGLEPYVDGRRAGRLD
jgi:2-dehydropantoate 2-reductase